MKNLLYEVPYATFANYSPRGTSDLSKKSRSVCSGVKAANLNLLNNIIQRLQKPECKEIVSFLTSDRVLVPIPGSAPRKTKDSVWPPSMIAHHLVAEGYGSEVREILQRVSAVPKSAFAAPGERPSVQVHIESMEVNKELLPLEKITLIDDVITRGRTSFAAAQKIHEAFPKADIKIFSVIRTQGLIPNITELVDPSVGSVIFNKTSGDVDRQP